MIEYKGETFLQVRDRGDAVLLENMRFEDCVFSNCSLYMGKEIAKRSHVRNVEIKNCEDRGSHIGPAVLEDISINGLKIGDLLIIWGAVFKHVKLSGPIGAIKINRQAHFMDRTDEMQKPFDVHRTQFYGSIDWALDISEARFREIDMHGIPARLIKRDPESQVVVKREKALMSGWREGLGPDNKLWPLCIKMFLRDGYEDTVLVAPLGASKKRRDLLLNGLQELRDVGVAEPD